MSLRHKYGQHKSDTSRARKYLDLAFSATVRVEDKAATTTAGGKRRAGCFQFRRGVQQHRKHHDLRLIYLYLPCKRGLAGYKWKQDGHPSAREGGRRSATFVCSSGLTTFSRVRLSERSHYVPMLAYSCFNVKHDPYEKRRWLRFEHHAAAQGLLSGWV